ncbi:hypothetical protein MSG28_009495 [Choristoneura fumiferana]|uniref:Uncharacterized protein n=1 Tax=Choristoneura fumiferana TaxID=7141 RepID=A0ACC0JBD5_CHOFU|nr:hypothetical protein MSG28_009495 [Choristoneura fumiferana]
MKDSVAEFNENKGKSTPIAMVAPEVKQNAEADTGITKTCAVEYIDEETLDDNEDDDYEMDSHDEDRESQKTEPERPEKPHQVSNKPPAKTREETEKEQIEVLKLFSEVQKMQRQAVGLRDKLKYKMKIHSRQNKRLQKLKETIEMKKNILNQKKKKKSRILLTLQDKIKEDKNGQNKVVAMPPLATRWRCSAHVAKKRRCYTAVTKCLNRIEESNKWFRSQWQDSLGAGRLCVRPESKRRA